MKLSETWHREKRRFREMRDTKKHLNVVYYHSLEDNGYLKTGLYSAGDNAHKNLMLNCDCSITWSGFGGFFNGLAEFTNKLSEADILVINFTENPEDEPAPGEGIISLLHHIEEAKKQNQKMKVYILSSSIIDIHSIEGAKAINRLSEING